MKKVVTFIIEVEVNNDNPTRIKKLIRTARTIIKETINNTEDLKTVKIRNEGV